MTKENREARMITYADKRRALRLWGNTAYARRWLQQVAADKERAEPLLLMHGSKAKWGYMRQEAK